MTEDPNFSKNAQILSSHIALSKSTGEYKFREFEKDTIVLLSYEVNEAFYRTKGLHEMKNWERYRYHIFSY